MNLLTKIFALSLLVSIAHSFQCDTLFNARECGRYAKAEASLKNVVGKTELYFSKVLYEINNEVIEMYEKILNSLKNMKLETKVIHTNDGHTIVLNGTEAVEYLTHVTQEMLVNLKRMKEFHLDETSEEAKKIKALIAEVFGKIYGNGINNGYLILDKIDLQAIRDYIDTLIPGPILSLLRGTITKIIDRHQNRLETIGKYLRPVMDLAGKGDLYDKIAAKIHEIIEKAKKKVNNQYAMLLAPEIQQTKDNLIAFIDGAKQNSPMVKRDLSDVWSKVQKALESLGDNVKKSTKDLVKKYKPKVVESLDKLKKVIIEGAKKIVIELQGDIVKIITKDL